MNQEFKKGDEVIVTRKATINDWDGHWAYGMNHLVGEKVKIVSTNHCQDDWVSIQDNEDTIHWTVPICVLKKVNKKKIIG